MREGDTAAAGRAVVARAPVGMILALSALAFAVAACASARRTTAVTPAERAVSAAWRCGDRTVALESGPGDRLRMTVAGEAFEVYPVPAASGAKYEAAGDPSTFLWTKGERAMLEVHGERAPECVAVAPGTATLTAHGNEPGWRVDIDAMRLVLLLDYGRRRLETSAPAAESVPGGWRYRTTTTDGPLLITVREAVCEDSMTGMPYPLTVTVTLGERSLTGCGGEADTLLRGGEWRVVEIDGQPPVAGSRTTLRFGTDGRVTGHASCNRYTAGYRLTGEELHIGAPVATKMACPDPILAQEARFLTILGATRRFAVRPDGSLVLDAGTEGRIVARRR